MNLDKDQVHGTQMFCKENYKIIPSRCSLKYYLLEYLRVVISETYYVFYIMKGSSCSHTVEV
jgi:hypothetical protein